MSDRRTVILEAEATVIARCGVRGLRVEELAAEASVSKALAYYHFEDRTGLLRRTLAFVSNRAERYTTERHTTGQSAADATADPLRRLEQALLLELQDLPHVRENSTAWGELRASAVFDPELRGGNSSWRARSGSGRWPTSWARSGRRRRNPRPPPARSG